MKTQSEYIAELQAQAEASRKSSTALISPHRQPSGIIHEDCGAELFWNDKFYGRGPFFSGWECECGAAGYFKYSISGRPAEFITVSQNRRRMKLILQQFNDGAGDMITPTREFLVFWRHLVGQWSVDVSRFEKEIEPLILAHGWSFEIRKVSISDLP